MKFFILISLVSFTGAVRLATNPSDGYTADFYGNYGTGGGELCPGGVCGEGMYEGYGSYETMMDGAYQEALTDPAFTHGGDTLTDAMLVDQYAAALAITYDSAYETAIADTYYAGTYHPDTMGMYYDDPSFTHGGDTYVDSAITDAYADAFADTHAHADSADFPYMMDPNYDPTVGAAPVLAEKKKKKKAMKVHKKK